MKRLQVKDKRLKLKKINPLLILNNCIYVKVGLRAEPALEVSGVNEVLLVFGKLVESALNSK